MGHLTLTFFLAVLLYLVVQVDVANALPQCSKPSYLHNCVDAYTFNNGDKYDGAFKDNKYNGWGTHIFVPGLIATISRNLSSSP